MASIRGFRLLLVVTPVGPEFPAELVSIPDWAALTTPGPEIAAAPADMWIIPVQSFAVQLEQLSAEALSRCGFDSCARARLIGRRKDTVITIIIAPCS
jgi:hypothetical protein